MKIKKILCFAGVALAGLSLCGLTAKAAGNENQYDFIQEFTQQGSNTELGEVGKNNPYSVKALVDTTKKSKFDISNNALHIEVTAGAAKEYSKVELNKAGGFVYNKPNTSAQIDFRFKTNNEAESLNLGFYSSDTKTVVLRINDTRKDIWHTGKIIIYNEENNDTFYVYIDGRLNRTQNLTDTKLDFKGKIDSVFFQSGSFSKEVNNMHSYLDYVRVSEYKGKKPEEIYLAEDFNELENSDNVGKAGYGNEFKIHALQNPDSVKYGIKDSALRLFVPMGNYKGFAKADLRNTESKSNLIVNVPNKSLAISGRYQFSTDEVSSFFNIYFPESKIEQDGKAVTVPAKNIQLTLNGISGKWHDFYAIYNNFTDKNDTMDFYIDGSFVKTIDLGDKNYDSKISSISAQIGSTTSTYKQDVELLVDDIVVKALDLNREFENVETKSSLKITYKDNVADVDLRFGGIIPEYIFDSNAEYGVIVLNEADTIFNIDTTKLQELKTNGKAIVAEPAKVDTGYQFAWVITNMEGHYDTKLNAYMYTLKDGKVTLSKIKKSTSAIDVANIYLGTKENPNPYGLSERLINTLKSIKGNNESEAGK